MNNGKRSIAIIGGGASAALLLAHLARRPAAENLIVDIYDRTGRFARGVAYSTQQDCHLLNVRAANMSAFQEEKDHFANWAAEKGYAPTDFVPRKLYGVYLTQRMDEAAQIFAVNFIKEDVTTSIQNADGTFTVANKIYNDVILATGNVRPLCPRVEGNVRGYYDDPWTADIPALLKAKTIALIGSGLTAVDMVLTLEEKGYAGKITIFSRNALLPLAHVDPAPVPSISLDTNLSPLALLRILRESAQQTKPWHSVIDSLRSHTNPIWQSWSARQRAQFNKRLLTFWNVHRHRMAPQIAAVVARLREQARLHLIKAGVKSIEAGPVVRSRVGDIAVDAVVNCLGYRYEEEGRRYEVSEKLGPARFGELFETTAIPEIRAQAYDIAQKILS